MPRIIHFDVPADDPKRAQKFYQDVFGWKFDKWNGPMEYWMAKTGDDKNLELMVAWQRECQDSRALQIHLTFPQ
jgi:predicted enzyme related to lactoylglutathione lyase